MNPTHPPTHLLLFRIGPVYACTDTRPVLNITPPPALSHPPGSGGSRPGLFRHSSGLVRVIDLRERLGIADTARPQNARLVITRLDVGLIGFLVDSIAGVIDAPATGWGRLPAHLPRHVFPRTLLYKKQLHLETDLDQLATWHDAAALHAVIRALPVSAAPPGDADTGKRPATDSASTVLPERGKTATAPPPVPSAIPANTPATATPATRPRATPATRSAKPHRQAPGAAPRTPAEQTPPPLPPRTQHAERHGTDTPAGQKPVFRPKPQRRPPASAIAGSVAHRSPLSENNARKTPPTSPQAATSPAPASRSGPGVRAARPSPPSQPLPAPRPPTTTAPRTPPRQTEHPEGTSTAGRWTGWAALILLALIGGYAVPWWLTPPDPVTPAVTASAATAALAGTPGQQSGQQPDSPLSPAAITPSTASRLTDRLARAPTASAPGEASPGPLGANPHAANPGDTGPRHAEQVRATPPRPDTHRPARPHASTAHDVATVTGAPHARIRRQSHELLIVLDDPVATAPTPPSAARRQAAATDARPTEPAIARRPDAATQAERPNSLQAPRPRPVETQTHTAAPPAFASSAAVPAPRTATPRMPPVETDSAAVSDTPSPTGVPQRPPSRGTATTPRMRSTEIVHVVVRGDTLWAIAERYIHNPYRYPELARLSRIRNPDLIYPGDRVRIIHRQSR